MAAFDGLAAVIEGVGDFLHDPMRHVVVYLTRELDKACVDAIFLGFPGQVEGVYRDAVASKAGAGGVGYEAERLGGGGLYYFMDIDTHFIGDDLEFIDQANIDGAVDVLK